MGNIQNKPFFSLLVTETERGLMDTVTEVPLDVVSARTYRFAAKVTENPIEDGSVINDHVVEQPDVVTVEGIVSDTPVTRASGVTSPAEVKTKGNVEPGLGERRSQGAYDLMEDIYRGRLLCTLICEFTMFDDMILEQWEVQKSKDRTGGLFFSATFKKLVTVETLTGQLPPDVIAKLKRRRKKTTKGRDPVLQKYVEQQFELVRQGKVSKADADSKITALAQNRGSSWTPQYTSTRAST